MFEIIGAVFIFALGVYVGAKGLHTKALAKIKALRTGGGSGDPE